MLPCAVAGENEKVWAGARAGEYDENTVFPADSKHVPRHALGSSFRAHTRRARIAGAACHFPCDSVVSGGGMQLGGKRAQGAVGGFRRRAPLVTNPQ